MEPNDTETDMENGVKEVIKLGDDEVVPGGSRSGRTEKTKRGTASHKTDMINGRFDLVGLVCQPIVTGMATYRSLDSSFLTHRALIFNRSRTLVAHKRPYFSSSET